MITQDERLEIIKKGQEDGHRLFRVAEAIYKGLIILNWIGGVIGVIIAIALLASGQGVVSVMMGIGVIVATAIGCIINYVFAVLMTHGAKVLVHILFANLAVMDRENLTIDGGQS